MKTKNAEDPRKLSLRKTTLKHLTAVRSGIKAGCGQGTCGK
jgi:hypothetical protein